MDGQDKDQNGQYAEACYQPVVFFTGSAGAEISQNKDGFPGSQKCGRSKAQIQIRCISEEKMEAEDNRHQSSQHPVGHVFHHNSEKWSRNVEHENYKYQPEMGGQPAAVA